MIEKEPKSEEKRYTHRESILQEAIKLTTGDRNNTYGPPDQDFARTAKMVSAMLENKLSAPLAPEDIAKIVICIKLSRLTWAHKPDSWVDIAGYAACGHECCELAMERAADNMNAEVSRIKASRGGKKC